jgi:hypothetical protein
MERALPLPQLLSLHEDERRRSEEVLRESHASAIDLKDRQLDALRAEAAKMRKENSGTLDRAPARPWRAPEWRAPARGCRPLTALVGCCVRSAGRGAWPVDGGERDAARACWPA